MKVSWAPVEPPLDAVAAAAPGPAGDRLAARAEAHLSCRLVRFAGWTVALGDDLPWTDGVTYLGRLPGAGRVLVPVHRRPDVHPELVARLVPRLGDGVAGDLAFLPDRTGEHVAVLRLPAQP